MKLSNYNKFVKHDGKYICFNAMSGGLFTITVEQRSAIIKYEHDVQELEKKVKPLYDALVKTRFIIPDTMNELNIIKLRYQRDVFINNNYHLIINPTMDCNFKCWYCYETHKKSKMSVDIQKGIVKHLKALIEDRKISGLSLSWFGGEPLLFFEDIIYSLSRQLKQLMENEDMPFTNSMTTNGYLFKKGWINKIIDINIKHFQITLDGNKAKHDNSRTTIGGGKTYDKIVNNINMLCKEIDDLSITLRINYKNETLDDINEIINSFDEDIRHKINVSFHRIWQTYDEDIILNDKYSVERDKFKASGFVVNNSSFQLYKGCKCYADRWNEILLNYDGLAYKCTARNFTKENSLGELQPDGKIKWDTAKLANRFCKSGFDNAVCLDCKLLPMCGGFCSQKIIEVHEKNLQAACQLNFQELSVDDFIINRYKLLLSNKHSKITRHIK